MKVHVPVGEDEVIRKNMELSQRKDFSAADLERLPEHVRADLIDGQIFYFASPKVIHQKIIGKLYAKLEQYIGSHQGKCQAFVSPIAVRLDCDDKTAVEPDVIVVCDEEKIQEDACYGAPDLVIEVTSRSTRQRDYGLKMIKYREAGVKEYWIIEPERRVMVVYWFEDERKNDLYSFEDEVSFYLFPDLRFRMDDLIGN